MYRMVLDLLNLVRSVAGIVAFEGSPVNIAALLYSVVEKFKP